jgi:putative transposase
VVDATGGPLGAMLAGAHVHDTMLLTATLEARVGDRPPPTAAMPQHLCLDKGDENSTGHEAVTAYQDTPQIRRIGEEKLDTNGEKTYPARRWVGERTLAWLSTGRGLLGRYEKKAVTCFGLLHLACALIGLRRRARLSGD